MPIKKTDADLLRDLALELEHVSPSKAKRLMELALIARPTGAFIQKKVKEYNSISEIQLSSVNNTPIELKHIFYQHIAKAGGTSINAFLVNHVEKEHSQTHIESLDLQKEKERLQKLEFISGHKRYFHIDKLFGLQQHYCISMIRNPLEHLVSHLKWVMKVSENQDSDFFKNHPETIRELSLYMRSIDWGNFNQVEAFFKYESKTGINLFNNCQTRYFLSNQFGQISEMHFTEATQRMQQFNLIGKLEFEDVFMKELCSDLKTAYQPLKKLNTNPSKSFIDLENPQILNLLLEQIQYDIKLYNSFDKVYRGSNAPTFFSKEA